MVDGIPGIPKENLQGIYRLETFGGFGHPHPRISPKWRALRSPSRITGLSRASQFPPLGHRGARTFRSHLVLPGETGQSRHNLRHLRCETSVSNCSTHLQLDDTQGVSSQFTHILLVSFSIQDPIDHRQAAKPVSPEWQFGPCCRGPAPGITRPHLTITRSWRTSSNIWS